MNTIRITAKYFNQSITRWYAPIDRPKANEWLLILIENEVEFEVSYS